MSVRFKWPPDLAAFQFGSALIWALRDGGISASITGISPLSLVNAIAKPITKLLQHGKVAVSGSTLTCNNGELVAVDDELPIGYKRITSIKFDGDFWYDTNEILTGNDNVTMTLANTSSSGQNVFGSYNKTGTGVKNFSLYVYGGGSSSKSYFRYGEQLLRPQFGSGERTIIFGKDGTSGFLSDVTATPETFTTVATAYIGMLPNSSSAAYTGSIVGSILVGDRLKYIPCERVSDGFIGYYEMVNGVFLEPVGTGTPVKGDYDTSHCTVVSVAGTPEEIVVSASGAEDQTAHAENLYAVGDIEDTQDVISGIVIRRTEAVVSDGTTPSGRYVGTVGEGNIIIKAREEGYIGEIVSFETEEETPLNGLIVSLFPQQDLHGYDSPWPAGGGVNKFDGQIEQGALDPSTGTKIPNAERYRSANFIGVKPSTRYRISVNGTATLANIYSYDANKTFLPNVERPYTNDFTTGADTYFIMFFGTNALNSDKVQIEEGSSITAWTPFSNICPISGWTGCEVYRTGKNLIDVSDADNTRTNTGSATIRNATANLKFKPNTQYTFSISTQALEQPSTYKVWYLRFYYTDGTATPYVPAQINNDSIEEGQTMKRYTVISDAGKTVDHIELTQGTDYSIAYKDVMLEEASAATDYEPHNGNSYSVTFGETVYGATPDIVSGEMPVTYRFVPDISTLYWHRANNNIFYATDLPIAGIQDRAGVYLKCSAYKGGDAYNGVAMTVQIRTDDTWLWICDTRYNTTADFVDAIQGVQLAYKVVTPTETAITPTPITALKGYNAVWSDAGAVAVYVLTGDLTEQVTPQKLNTAEGDNTITVTAEVEDIVFDVTYRENNPDG